MGKGQYEFFIKHPAKGLGEWAACRKWQAGVRFCMERHRQKGFF